MTRGRWGFVVVLRQTFNGLYTTSSAPKTIFLFLKIQNYHTHHKIGLDMWWMDDNVAKQRRDTWLSYNTFWWSITRTSTKGKQKLGISSSALLDVHPYLKITSCFEHVMTQTALVHQLWSFQIQDESRSRDPTLCLDRPKDVEAKNFLLSISCV